MDFTLTCPKCRGAMFHQRHPANKFPWKIGTPIAKCKNKDCATRGGVYWEDSVPKDTPHGPPHATPQPIAAAVHTVAAPIAAQAPLPPTTRPSTTPSWPT